MQGNFLISCKTGWLLKKDSAPLSEQVSESPNTNVIFFNTLQNQLRSRFKVSNKFCLFTSAAHIHVLLMFHKESLGDRSTQPLTEEKFHCLIAEDDGGHQLYTAGSKYLVCATFRKLSFQIHIKTKLLTFLFPAPYLTQRPTISSN
jgi:hypothetical protein